MWYTLFACRNTPIRYLNIGDQNLWSEKVSLKTFQRGNTVWLILCKKKQTPCRLHFLFNVFGSCILFCNGRTAYVPQKLLYKRTFHESFTTFYIITTKKYIDSHDTFIRECSTNLALLTLQPKPHFCDLRLYKRTFYESFKSFSVFTAKHETDNWVDSTVRGSHINGDFPVYPETTR